jgi:hypothetical protein
MTPPAETMTALARVLKLPAGWTAFALGQYRPGNPDKRSDHDRNVVNGGTAGLAAPDSR